jgi:hypothetical protein
MIVSRDWGNRKRDNDLMGTVSIWDDGNALLVDGGNSFVTMWITLMSLNHILKKWLKW